MCGLIVVIGKGMKGQAMNGLRRMLHRGIRYRVEEKHGAAIGHVRLPIVGLGEEYDQPVERDGWTIAFTGEILDFQERDPTAECDLETVVRTWTESGPKGFQKFDGFWHIVAYEEKTGILHAVVDYLGQKPLYIRSDVYAVAVASELDALRSLGPLELDQVYLSAVAKWGYCPEPARTPYRSVSQMAPGNYARVYPSGRVETLVVDHLEPVSGVTLEELKKEIQAAVRRRVTSSDVPVACLVSGGLDSSIVYTIAERYGKVTPYHAANDELEECRRVVPGIQELPLEEVNLLRALRYMQEPLDLGSLVPQVALSDAIGRTNGERVCLTGDGADELFGGYGRAKRYDSQASDVWHELPKWHLPRLDRVMMRNRVEIRSPFLARRVASVALGLPKNLRTGKKVLRDLFLRDLPKGVADTPKRPLKSREVRIDREKRSLELIKLFQEWHEQEYSP